MHPNLNMVIDQVAKDKNIDKKVLVETLEQAILTAAKKVFGMHREIEARYNDQTGIVDLFLVVIVTDNPQIYGREIAVGDAQKIDPGAQPGDELLFQIIYRDEDAEHADEEQEKWGQVLDLRDTVKHFGRIAAQTAKQVIIQRVREAERENVFNEYKDRKGELITGIVRRFERGNIIVDLGRAEAILPVREQVPRESYRAGDRIVAYVLDIERNARGPQIVLSRTAKGLVEKLFEMEVPEIYEKIVRIEAVAREPGARAKIAVSSRDRDVDPVGACVGIKGSRVQAVVQELRGEKIDIVPYDPDPARFVCNAIAPAEVSRVLIDAETHTMELIVPDDKLSLAIGKKGQNVRLASQLTGWKIDIHSESKVRELEEQAKRQMASIEHLGEELAETLFKLGWRSPSDLAEAAPEELAAVPGLGGGEAAQKIIAAAKTLLVEEARRLREESERRAREAQKTPEERMLSVKGVGPEVAAALGRGGLKTAEELAHAKDVRALGAASGLGAKRASKLVHAARIYLGELPPDAPEPEVEDEPSASPPVPGAAGSEIDAGWDLK